MTDSPLDQPTPDGMERAFRMPAYIAEDEGMSALFNSMVERLRREAQGLPMNTVQQLLIERMASFYVQIKWKEDHDQWSGASQQKDFNTYWLSLTTEFNRLLAASDDKLRAAMLVEVQGVVNEALELVSDREERRSIRRKMAEDFAAINL
jgi:hypothetical protein